MRKFHSEIYPRENQIVVKKILTKKGGIKVTLGERRSFHEFISNPVRRDDMLRIFGIVFKLFTDVLGTGCRLFHLSLSPGAY